MQKYTSEQEFSKLTASIRIGIACVLLSHAFAGCGGSPGVSLAPSPPAAPAAAAPGPTVLADVTLSGVVYESRAEAPGRTIGIDGVSVYCEQCGASSHNYAYTDATGEYVFPRGVWTEGRPSFPARIWVHKDGYDDPAGLPHTTPPNPSGPGWREVVIDGDTRFDMELVRR